MPLLMDSHLSWGVFGIIAYALLGLLITDFVWRSVQVRAVVLLPLAAGVWCVSVLVVFWAAGFGYTG